MDSNQAKTFVIDTNVLIHKPDALLSFRDNEIIVPLWVLEELDKLKTYSDEKGRNARHAIRFLDEQSKHGDLSHGVKMENGSVLQVIGLRQFDTPLDVTDDKIDNKIIATAYMLQKEGRRVFFVSKDINARVKATSIGIKAVDYEKQKVNISDLYPGCRTLEVSTDLIRSLKKSEAIPWKDACLPNEYFILKNSRSGEQAIARCGWNEGTLEMVEQTIYPVCGVRPLNDKQIIAFNALLDPRISLVTLVGKAGTGKTLLAIAAGLKMTMEEKLYKKVLVTRPVIPMGKDIGYLPGAKTEKLSHWMQPLFDNLEYILSEYKKPHIKGIDTLINNNNIEIEALTYIRGRSLPNQYIIIDEAQNLSPHEIKTIVSRAGEGTKVVLTGDPYQIDSPYLDSSSNGLTFLVEAFKNQSIYAHITLDKSERSRLAELAAELL